MNSSNLDRLGIAVDVDDTLAATAQSVINVLLTMRPELTKQSAELVYDYDQPDKVPFFSADIYQQKISHLLNDPDFLLSVPLQPDVKPDIFLVHQVLPIKYYITSRPNALATATTKWLKLHQLPPAPLITRHLENRSPSWKMELLAQTPDVIALIEDNPAAYVKSAQTQFIWLKRSKGNQLFDHISTQPRNWKEVLNWARHQSQLINIV